MQPTGHNGPRGPFGDRTGSDGRVLGDREGVHSAAPEPSPRVDGLSRNSDTLSFAVYVGGSLAERVNLSGAYMVGSDDVPLRADITFKDGHILCRKRAAGPAGLALLWEVNAVGAVMLETIRVEERERPYILQIELARGRMLRLLNKLEDWGLLEQADGVECLPQIDAAREALIRALQAESAAAAAAMGEEALTQAVTLSEDISRRYAQVQLARRKQSGGLGRRVFGCGVPLDAPRELAKKRLNQAVDFVTVPIVWRDVEPAEQSFDWKALDGWVETLSKLNLPLRGTPLLSFHERNVPDWLYIWEHDFDTIRDLAFEHARRIVNRYGQFIQSWVVVSGIHANNCFSFNFEQLMELTRMTAALTKQLSPRGSAIIDIIFSWGEYYARNQRTIPPALYAEMTVQSGINFDAFGVQFHFGANQDGMFVRDMFQISTMLDQLSKMGKPVHVTAVEVPSHATQQAAADCGAWHEPWNETVQSDWLRQFVEIALSKPNTESINWHSLVDRTDGPIEHGGLLRGDQAPKPAFEQYARLRRDLLGKGKPAGSIRT